MSDHENKREDDTATVLIAGFETPTYEFMCAAQNRAEAIALFRKAWRTHCDQTGADPTYFTTDDVWTVRIRHGQVLRDGHPIR